jgi:aminoglycoside phosphotransferase (APT) family kinase protein
MLPADQLRLWLTAAFREQPGWIIEKTDLVHSFQQHMEHVTLAWPASGATADVFVRVFHSYLSWWTLVTPDLPLREQTAWTVAKRSGVPVAPVLYHGRVAGQDGAVIGRVRGVTGRTDLSPTLALNMAVALARLHGADLRPAERVRLPDCSLSSLLLRLKAWCVDIGADDLRQELRAIEPRLAKVDERRPSLLHGDCHPGNILVDGDTVTAMIDWEEAGLGDPRIDVCWLDAAIRRRDPYLADLFLGAYEERAGYELGDLQIWAEFLELRYQIVHAWIKEAVARGRALPSENPGDWAE